MTTTLIEQDIAQRKLALEATKSFIVQAPAGSGKTELLIQRLLVLLTSVNAPEEILAITFTKKAANEMRERVMNALKEAANTSEPELPHKRHTWQLAQKVLARDKQLNWHLLQNPNQLRIQTIDSLCAFLTKQLPLLSTFGSQPDIAQTPDYLYQETAHEVLMHIEEDLEWSESVAKLLLHLDNDLNKLNTLLVSLLKKRDQWLPLIHRGASENELKVQLEHHLELVVQHTLSNLVDNFPKKYISELMAIACFTGRTDSSELPGVYVEDLPIWIELSKLLLTKTHTWRKRVDADIGFPPLKNLENKVEKATHTEYRARHSALIEALSEHEGLRSALEELQYLPEAEIQQDQFEMLNHLTQVLKISVAQLRLTFQKYGQIDFIENALAALLALGDHEHPTDLALALDYKIQHILIDEFQDTSSTQYNLLKKLTFGWDEHDGRTLFVVGDPMQSIYRFREAEVGLFLRMWNDGIGLIKLHPITLSLNFRSSPRIVDWNNRHFAQIFPSFTDIATGAVSYNPSGSSKAEEANLNSEIAVLAFEGKNGLQQASNTANTILQIKAAHPQESIAILVRSRSHLKSIIPALKQANIAYYAVDIDPLASRQTIQDLLSLTCALLHPADRIAWLSVLRAPWCGLTLADLLILAGKNPYATIWEQLDDEKTLLELSQDGQQRLARILPILKLKCLERDRSGLRQWIESTWLLIGGPACLVDQSENEDIASFFKLLDQFSQDSLNLDIDKLKKAVEQSYASTPQDNSAVQIMTIHSAKGLEFDTVILPHLERKMPSNDKALLLWMEQPLAHDQIALLMAPINAVGDKTEQTYNYINRQQKIKLAFETDRLFYVAATRAKKRLHLYYCISEDKQDYADASSFLKKIQPFIAAPNIASQQVANIMPIDKDKHVITRLQTNWQNPIYFNLPTIAAVHQKAPGFYLDSDSPRLIGIVIHRFLQTIAKSSIAWWQQQSLDEKITLIKRQLKTQRMPEASLTIAAQTALTALDNTLADEKGKWILHAHREAQSEFALSAVIDNQKLNLVIDRTFVDEQDTRWIIDYKSTVFSDENLEDFLKKEQDKYSEKMEKYRNAFAKLEDRKIMLGLYFPLIPAWHIL